MIYCNLYPTVYRAWLSLSWDIACEFDVYGYQIWDFIPDYIAIYKH